MKKEEIETLTPEQKRTRIAQICGWTDVHRGNFNQLVGFPFRGSYADAVPDYLHSLDAMALAEKTIASKECQREYAAFLIELTEAEWCDDPREVFVAATATANQRADAFLLVVGVGQNNPFAP